MRSAADCASSGGRRSLATGRVVLGRERSLAIGARFLVGLRFTAMAVFSFFEVV